MSLQLEIGTVIGGRYQLERLLGQGGMATVWEAKHLMTRRLVAMKFLHAALDARPEMRRRFLREAQAAAAVDHPNVVTVHDVFHLDDGTLVLVMARLEGETFAAMLMRKAPLTLAESVAVMAPVVSAVGSAHSRGVIHRDLKPENVFLSLENGNTVVKVLDFGIAKVVEQEDTGGLTTTGTVLGTPCYMAPEQAYAEKSIDHRADIWSLGAMLYEALTGARPIEGDSLGQVVKHMLTQSITPIFVLAPGLPNEIALLVMRMLRLDPEGRPSDLREVHAVLARYAPGSTPSFGPPASSDAPRASLTQDGDATLLAAPEGQKEVGVDGRVTTLAQTRATESWKPLSVGSPSTTGAHAVAITSRRGHRRLYLVLSGAAAALALFAIIWKFRPAQVNEDAKRLTASPAAPLESPSATVPAAPRPDPPSAPPSPPHPSSSAPQVAPASLAAKQHPKTAPKRAAPAALAPPVAAPSASAPAPSPKSSETPSPSLRPTTGLHDAVPF